MATKAEQFAKQQDALKKAGVDINKYNAAIASGASTQDALKAGGYTGQQATSTPTSTGTPKTTTTTSSTPKATTTTSAKADIAVPEYQGTGTNKINSYQNQGEGTYKYDEGTKYYEKQGTDSYSKVRDKWDSLTYAQQQEKLKQNPNLKAGIEKAGGTFKTEETTPATGTTGTKTGATPKQGEWDYQDDSPERMAEIAANLEGYKQTMPYLFNDKRAFDDFFINGKGRSQAQIDFLNQWFENNQKYSKYDALTPDSIGYGIAYGDIPEDYLTMLKTTDPAKYQAALQAKQDAEDKIKDRTALDTTNVLSGDSEATITSKAIEWLKTQGLFLDKDGNLIDDRTENYATDEEKQYAKDAADIIARNLDIDNTVKHTYEDLVKAYPGATKATLMAMAQDRNSDLLREKENNNVELTRLQGYMDYMQSERQERNRIGESAIKQLQEQYGMYYDYTPEGMSELAQAKYAATNVTLDQADNGTDTQKQMALDKVLSDYYDKYGSIIQRSKSQVINDVMALAKQKGISLSQALEENFLKYLRQKPEYSQLNTITSNPNVVRIGTDSNGNPIYGTYNSSTGTFDAIDLSNYGISSTGNGGGIGGKETTPGGVSYNSVSETAKINGLSDFLSGLNVGDYRGECGAFVNDYLQSIGAGRIYDNDLSTKLKSINSDTPEIGSVAVFDYSNAPTNSRISDKARKHGHVGVVVGYNADAGTVTIVESNKDGDNLISKPREIPLNNLYLKGYFNPSQGYTESSKSVNNFGGKFTNDSDWNKNGYFDSLVPYFKTIVQEGKIDLTDTKYEDVKKDYGITSKEFNEMAANYANTELKSAGGQQAANALEYAIKTYELLYGNKSKIGNNRLTRNVGQIVPGSEQEKARAEYDSLMKRLSLKELFAAKDLGATFGAMSDSEWSLLEKASTDVQRGHSNFKENLEGLIQSLYDAAIDGKATLPKNLKGSSLEQMLTGDKTSGNGGNNGGNDDIYSDLY